VADVAGDLSSGTLYAAKLTETDATKRNAGGAFDIAFVKLGHASSSQVEALANKYFQDNGQTGAWQGIFEGVFKDFKYVSDATYTTSVTTANGATVYLKPADAAGKDTYTLINFGSTQQLIKIKSGSEVGAAFLETERYASYLGATMEFTKLEGVALNIKDKKAYLAMSAIKATMTDNTTFQPAANNVLKLSTINAGATYEVVLGTDATIGSDWVPKSMSVPTKLLGKDLGTADSYGNSADIDTIANVDNLWFSEAMRTLFLGEDSGMHVNNYVWAYNVDTQVLSRIFSAPAGAECTGLQAVDNLNGFAYVMSNFQHPGDWESIHNTLLTATGSTLNAEINANWSDKNKAALGYMVLPAIGA
jgi:secreted PhoX family phosphatase